MTEHTGLIDQANYDAFCEKWRTPVMNEAAKWCRDPAAQALLADAVLLDFRRQYEDRTPPERMEYFIRAQACLVFSETGQNTARLNNYIALRTPELPPEPQPVKRAAPAVAPVKKAAPAAAPVKKATPAAMSARRAVRKAPVQEIVEEQVAEPEKPRPADGMYLPRSQLRARRARAASAEPATPVATVAPAAKPAATAPAAKPAASAPVAKPVEPEPAPAPVELPPAPKKPDTFIDPERTAMWTPGELDQTEHLVKEVYLPDEEEDDSDERSSKLSLANTLVFILMVAAIGFMLYESHLIQHYLL